MRVKRVHHIALRSKDLAASVKFYGEKFRFPEVLRYDFDDGSPCCVYMQVADGQFIEHVDGRFQEGACWVELR